MNSTVKPVNDGVEQQLPADEVPAILRVSVLGGVHFSYAGRDIELRNRKARAVFGYIALTQNAEEQREKLAGLLWSEFGEGNARATLRQAVHEFRAALAKVGCSALAGTRTTVGFRPGSFTVDLDAIHSAVAAKNVHDAMLRQERLAETVMAGYDDLDPAFHVWLVARRQALHDRLIRGLEEGYRDAAIERRRRRLMAEATLLLDPTHEEACRLVMRAAAEAGETSQAIRAYDELYRLLDEDYDMEPAEETQALIADIKLGRLELPEPPQTGSSYAVEVRQGQVASWRAADQAALVPPAPKPALFIEAFGTNGVDPDRIHLVHGFRLELIASLARFREWYVSANNTHVSDELRVSAHYAVVTNAYQAGASINVVMVLQERSSERVVWGERFELTLDRWFDVQRKIVRRIAANLNVRLSMERLERLSHVPDVSLEAHDMWLRGQSFLEEYNIPNWNRAVEMFAKGIDQAPAFSPLYSSLVQSNNGVHVVQTGMFHDAERARRTLDLAQKAVALDPRDSRAELCLGWANAMCKRYGTAAIHFELACELNDNDPWTFVSVAMFHAFGGNVPVALDFASQAMDMALAPTSRHWVYEACIRYLCGDPTACVAAVDRVQGKLHTLPAWRAAALQEMGRTAEARESLERFYEAARANWIDGTIPSERMIAAWFMQVHPISRPEVWERLRNALAAVGLPVDGLVFSGHAPGK